MDVYASFLETSRRHHLFDGASRILLAVSGGSDSTALLYLFHRLLRLKSAARKSLAGQAPTASGRVAPACVAVAHLDHGIRETVGERDARQVAAWARELGLEFFSGRVSWPPGESTSEARLRHHRLKFLQRVAGQWGATGVALGHTLDDQAETFLLRLLRGSATRGLGGMRLMRPGEGVPLIRPLLKIRHQALRDWLTGQGITWLEDPTNAELTYLRNRVRQQLTPLLEALRPGATAATARAAHLLQDDEDLLWEQTTRHFDLVERRGAVLHIDVRQLARLPRPLSRRLLRHAGARLLDSPHWSPTAQHLDDILDRLPSGGQARGSFHLGAGLKARLSGGTLSIWKEPAPPPQPGPGP